MSTAVATREMAVVVAPNPQEEALRRIASQQTPKDEIRVRVGRGGMQLKYTDGAYVIRTLNQAFGWDWDFVADSEELLLNNGQPFEVKVRGTLTVRLDGRVITKTQFGCQPIEMLKNGTAPVSIGDCYKGAATDAMKKCASLLGIALDLYDSDYKAEKYAEPITSVGFQEVRPPEPEPVKTVKLEGAQPTSGAGLPEMEGAAGHVVELARKLKWGEAALAGAIAENFGIVIAPGKLQGYLECATKDELRELYRAMDKRSRTK